MSVTATLVVLWMVCGLGSVTFAAVAAASGRLRLFGVAVAAAAAATWWWGPPDAPIVGVLAALAAGLPLVRPGFAPVAVAAGGALGGVWPLVVRLDPGVTAASVTVCATALAASAWLSRTRPAFAPEILQDDARLILLASGLSLAALPGILDGWQSALTLNAAAPASDATPVPAWTLTAVAGALALGGVHTTWSRR